MYDFAQHAKKKEYKFHQMIGAAASVVSCLLPSSAGRSGRAGLSYQQPLLILVLSQAKGALER